MFRSLASPSASHSAEPAAFYPDAHHFTEDFIHAQHLDDAEFHHYNALGVDSHHIGVDGYFGTDKSTFFNVMQLNYEGSFDSGYLVQLWATYHDYTTSTQDNVYTMC